MLTYNKVTIIGYVGQDPEVRYTADGTAVANFSVATSDKWKDRAGQAQERTEWYNVVAWDKLAVVVGDYVKKGTAVFVEGPLQTDKWTDKEGGNRETKKIRAGRVIVLSDGKRRAAEDTADMAESLKQDDEVPF